MRKTLWVTLSTTWKSMAGYAQQVVFTNSLGTNPLLTLIQPAVRPLACTHAKSVSFQIKNSVYTHFPHPFTILKTDLKKGY